MARDIRYDYTHKLAIAPQVITDPGSTPDATEGDAIDLAGHQGVNVAFAFGEVADGTGDKLVATPSLEVAPAAAGPWTAAAAADVLGPTVEVADGTNDDEVWTLGYIGASRYIRAVIEAVGENGSMPVAAVAFLANPTRKPVTESTPEDVA